MLIRGKWCEQMLSKNVYDQYNFWVVAVGLKDYWILCTFETVYPVFTAQQLNQENCNL